MVLPHRIIPWKDADRLSNSVGPHQAALAGAFRSGSTLFAQTCLCEHLGPLRYCLVIDNSSQQHQLVYINEPHHEKTCLCHMQITKRQISLRIGPDRLAPLLFAAHWPRQISTFVVRCLDKLSFSFYIGNFMPQASFCSRADRFEYYLVENPDDRFSHDVAQF